MDLKQAFGAALRQIRTQKGLTQEDFSVVSSRTYLSTLERGEKSPTLEKIDALATKLDIHPLSLIALAYLNSEKDCSLEELLALVEKELKDIDGGKD